MISLALPGGASQVSFPLEKLVARARLPGASSFDQAAHAIRRAEAALAVEERLALAFPASWLVNSPAPSRTFQAWLSAPMRAMWCELVAVVAEGPEAWLASGGESRRAAGELVRRLASPQGGLEAVSKALALLAPQSVPLMPGPAVAFALGELGEEAAKGAAFVPMMDWFARAVLANEPELVLVARAYAAAPLDAAQVMDRLLWFESDGYVHFPDIPRA